MLPAEVCGRGRGKGGKGIGWDGRKEKRLTVIDSQLSSAEPNASISLFASTSFPSFPPLFDFDKIESSYFTADAIYLELFTGRCLGLLSKRKMKS